MPSARRHSGIPGLTPPIPFPEVWKGHFTGASLAVPIYVPQFAKQDGEIRCRCPGVVRSLVHVTKTKSGKEPSMTWQQSINPQHCVLRGEAAMPIDRQPASRAGKRSYLERRRD
jgi:hypothetical protein